jgi:hypothetical protein
LSFLTYLALVVATAIVTGVLLAGVVMFYLPAVFALSPHRPACGPGPLRLERGRQDRLRRTLQVISATAIAATMGANVVVSLLDGSVPRSIAIAVGIELTSFSVGAVIYAFVASRRIRRADLYWLRGHSVSSRRIHDLAHSRVLINLSAAVVATCDMFPFVWGAALIWDPANRTAAAAAAACVSLLILGALNALAVLVSGRMNPTDALLRVLGYACAPDRQPADPLRRLLSMTDDRHHTPQEIFNAGLSPHHTALLKAQNHLRAVLWRRLRQWPWINRAEVLRSTQPLFTDLTRLATSNLPAAEINANIAITRVIRLAVLGDLNVLGPDRLHLADLADHRAWNPWQPRRIITFAVGATTTVGTFLAALKNLTP